MKIAGLLPLKIDPEKSTLYDSAKDIIRVTDEFIILCDGPQPEARNVLTGLRATEFITVEGGDGVWNDFTNRLTLLARAAKYGCRWCAFIDDDEVLGPSLTRERVRQICTDADAAGQVVVSVSVRTAWNESQYRTDGLFGGQNKPLFQVNPLMLKAPVFFHTYDKLLHFFPRLEGPEGRVEDFLIHWGMRTRSLREKNVRKYQQADKEQKFSTVPYDYLLDETGMTLAPI